MSGLLHTKVDTAHAAHTAHGLVTWDGSYGMITWDESHGIVTWDGHMGRSHGMSHMGRSHGTVTWDGHMEWVIWDGQVSSSFKTGGYTKCVIYKYQTKFQKHLSRKCDFLSTHTT